MILSWPRSRALGALAAAALLAACNGIGGSAVTGPALRSEMKPPTSSHGMNALSRDAHPPSDTFAGIAWMGNVHPDRNKSWVSPDAQRAPRLLFVSDVSTNDVYIFTLPDMNLKGTLTGFNQPQGECSDTHGNVYIANTRASTVLKYSRAGTLLNTYADTYGYPVGCAVNPLNGNLAVTNIIGLRGHGEVLIYASPSSRPIVLTNRKQYFYYFAGYDSSGDLWVDGRTALKDFILSSCGASSCKTVRLHGGTIHFPGAVQWDQQEYAWALFDQGPCAGGGSCSFVASLSGVLVQLTNYKAYDGDPVCDLVQGVVAAYGANYAAGGDYERRRCGHAGGSSANRWQYPVGGAPTNYTTNVSHPDGAAISTK